VADLAPLKLPAFTANWHYLAAFIYSSQLQIRECAYKEIKEVLSGDCLVMSGLAVRQSVIWDPRDICRQRQIVRYDEAVTELREVAQTCIDAWAAIYNPVLHSLSGGFDSAVVLGCLSHSSSKPRITCVNQYAREHDEDERRYARLAADRAQVRLVELDMASVTNCFDTRLLAAPRMPKPSGLILSRLLEIQTINQLAAGIGSRTLWTGQGGDHIFLQTTAMTSAGDYLATRGCGRGLVAAIRDAALLSRQPYWAVLKAACAAAFKRGGRGSSPSRAPARTSFFLDPAALPERVDEYVAHPWASPATDVPGGKQAQIRVLSEVLNRHRPLPGLELAPQHHPLLSQPLMEMCLQIPTYLLVEGGRERALAREAFADRIPTEIIQRRDKGSVIGHAIEMIRRGETFIRELLLNGVLAEAGIIRPDELEPYLDGSPFDEDVFLPFVACLAAEVWTRTSLQITAVAPTA
jgi:asparagine synthase (glutamine-hydrolysing)